MRFSTAFRSCILTVFILFQCIDLSATHFMGVDISYECMGTCTYRIYHSTYYDCSGALTGAYTPISAGTVPPAPSDFDFGFTGIPTPANPFCNAPAPIGNWVLVDWVEVTPVCPTVQTQCEDNFAVLPGVGEARYYRDYDFCNTNCDEYTIQWSGCCRNNAITNVTNPGGQEIFTGSTTINTAIVPCNNSPSFAVPPVPYLCVGQAFTFNQEATDIDGDSLAYELTSCLDDNNIPVNYAPGYNPQQPLGASWNISLDPVTGDLTVTPNPGSIEVAVLCVLVKEYRNGQLIGQVTRDFQFTVINCNNTSNVNPVVDSLTNLSSNITVNGFDVQATACNLVRFDMPLTDPDPNQNWILAWNGNIADAVFADATNPTVGVDTISSSTPPTARFTWVPTTPGRYTFLLTAQDDGCPIFGINQYTIVIDVAPNPAGVTPTVDTRLSNCFDMEFEAIPCGGVPPFTYQWSGSNGLSGTDKIINFSYPGPGTYTYQITVTDSFGIVSSTVGTLNLTNTAIADGGPDFALCPGEVGTIGTPFINGQTYQWSSFGGIGFDGPSNPNTPQTGVSFNNGTNAPIPLDYFLEVSDLNGCVSNDTVTVTYTPTPDADIVADGSACINDQVSVNFNLPQVPGATYTWVYSGGGQGITTGPGPHNVSWGTPGVKEIKLVVNVNGCESDTAREFVTIFDIPTSTFTATPQVCANQQAFLTYTGTANPANTNFIWDLDGGQGTGNAGPFGVTWSTPGTKTITLVVEQNGCTSASFSQQVEVFEVPSSAFDLATDMCVDGIVQAVYTGGASPGASYAWNFAGGTVISGTGSGPYTLTWSTSGQRTLSLQVQENGCVSTVTTRDINVNADPVASISAVPNQCFSGNSFTFQYTGDPNVDTYNWFFGTDASIPVSTDAQPPAITYSQVGPKRVTLVVTRAGCVGDTAEVLFEVVPEPSADFTTSSTGICSDDCVTFNYSGVPIGPNQSYSWDFGPGAIPPGSPLPNPGCIEYITPGTKDVTLLVSYRGCTTSSTQSIAINPTPVVSVAGDVEFCEGDGGAQIQATASGGTAPLFYSWTCDDPLNCGLSSTSVEDPFANPDVDLTGKDADSVRYCLTVTDVNGCASDEVCIWVIVKAKPKMDAGPDVFICTDGPGEFILGGLAADNSAPEPVMYQWSPATGLNNPNLANPFARPTETTIYTLVGTSANGCTSEVNTLDTLSTVTVNVVPKPVAAAGIDTAICLGGSVQLQGFASGGGPDYTYSWTPATAGTIDDPTSPTPTVTPGFTTVYSLVVTSNGCDSDADQVEVVVGTQPTINPGANETICLGSEVQLDARAAGDPNASTYTYSWSPAIGLSDPDIPNPIASPDVTTTYTVSASSNFGCGSDDATITVTVEPTPEVEALSQDTVICAGDTIALMATHSFTTPTGSPVVYDWLPSTGIIGSPTEPNILIAPTQTTRYTVRASIAGDCPTEDEVLVTVSPKVEAKVSADTTQFCAGDVIQLFAEGGLGNANFSWSPAVDLDDPTSQNPFASPSADITYTVTVSEGACSDEASIDLIVNPTPQADYFATQTSGCEGLTVSFVENSENAVSFIWDFGDGSALSNESNPTHTYNTAGQYTVSLTTVGVGGCETTTSQTTVDVSASGFANFSSDPAPGTSISLPDAAVSFTDLSQNAINWLWDFGDGSISTDANPVHVYQKDGTYVVSLTVTDQNGCVSTVTLGDYDIFAPDLLIPNVFSPNGDGVNDGFTVRYTGKELFRMEVFDRWGRLLYEADAQDKPWMGTDSGGNVVNDGVYYYSVQIGDQTYTGNITLMR